MTEQATAAVARVLRTWLRQHGYPVVDDDETVPVAWLRAELNRLLAEPTVTGRSTARTAWRDAVHAVYEVLDRYEDDTADIRSELPAP